MDAGAPAERWQQFNALVKSYAVGLENNEIPAGLPVLSFIDSFEGLLAVGNSPTLYASDIIHLSADGYSYWNTWVDTTIDLLMSEEGSDCAVWLSNECELFLETSVESPSMSPFKFLSHVPSAPPTESNGDSCSSITNSKTCNQTEGCAYNKFDSLCKAALSTEECSAFDGKKRKCKKNGCKYKKNSQLCKGRWD